MEGLLVLVVIGCIVYGLAFSKGKREGSRKGYGVGLQRGRRSRRRR